MFNLLPQHFPFWATKLGLKLGATSGVSNGIKAVELFAAMTNTNPAKFLRWSEYRRCEERLPEAGSIFEPHSGQSRQHRAASGE
jgi:hypothetical protein